MLPNFGGAPEDNVVRRATEKNFLLVLPIGLDRGEVVERAQMWGVQNGWWLLEWNTDYACSRQVSRYTVKIRITNYPMVFWHPTFINHILTMLGEITEAD